MIEISYNRLWKKLIDLQMNKSKLRDLSGIGTGTLSKISKNEPVGLQVIARICFCLKCNIEEVVEVIYDK